MRYPNAAHLEPQETPTRAQRKLKDHIMSKVVYEIVEHDGGWAYKFNKVFSETYPTHAAAHAAAAIRGVNANQTA